jgi:hypothetical protein
MLCAYSLSSFVLQNGAAWQHADINNLCALHYAILHDAGGPAKVIHATKHKQDACIALPGIEWCRRAISATSDAMLQATRLCDSMA